MKAMEREGKVPGAVDLAMQRELTCILFGSPDVPLLHGVLIVLTTGVLWRVFPVWLSLSWLIISMGVVLLRVMLWAQFRKRRSEIGRYDEWARRFTITTVMIGCLWGVVASTVFVARNPIDYFFAAFVVMGLSAGEAIRNSPHPPAFYGFIVTAASPMVVALFLRGRLSCFALGCVVLAFLVVMILMGRENHQRLADFIRMKIEQEVLNVDLQKATLDVTKQNAVLRERSELLDNAQDAIFVLDMSLRLLYWNKGAERLFGWTQQEVICREIGDVFPDGRAESGRALEQVKEHGRWSGEISKRDKQGHQLTVASRCTLVGNPDERSSSIFVINTDVTEQKTSRARIHRLAYYDEVTKLPNRVLLRERLQNALRMSHMTGQAGALLFIDMDDFKTLNDTAGHEVGDLLLEQIAGRLRSTVRASDCVARLGGDEFVVLVETLGTDREAAGGRALAIGGQVLRALREVYHLQSYEYRCTASVGVTLMGDDSIEVDDLMKQAEMAMYRSKAQGRNMVCLFDPGMERELASRAAMVADLRRALQSREFELMYQPQLDSEGRVVGCEALVRWRHPQRGLLSPAEFIPVAESGGMIVELGTQALGEACRRLAMWQDRPGLRDLSIAVNVSSRQFADPQFVQVVEDALRSTGVDPSRLKLEITESAAMEKVHEVIQKMMTLKALGIKLSLDDFGTGYSSLSQLKLLPLHQLKIDKSFVNDIVGHALDASIVQTIIDLGRNLNLEVIAEGVETVEQVDFLKAHGCRLFQGYLFSKPLSAVAFEEFAIGIRQSRDGITRGHGVLDVGTMVPWGATSANGAVPDSWRAEPMCAGDPIPSLS
ncbi:MAG TPA: EAL domain-containing protein [Acidobacteriaceae bacterium]|nr:EAL domain-containing protein [Acidobacteriaceae bacterium]